MIQEVRSITTTHEAMTCEERAKRVDELFKSIAFIADTYEYKKNDISKQIEPMVKELWAITQCQERLHELDYKRVGIKRPF